MPVCVAQTKRLELQGMRPHLDAIVLKCDALKLDLSSTEQYKSQLSENSTSFPIRFLCASWCINVDSLHVSIVC